jgi:hypothetical protein
MMASMGFDPADEWWGGDLVRLPDDALGNPGASVPAPVPVEAAPDGSGSRAEDWALPVLATAPLPIVRLAVACSPRCPSEVLTTLATDPDPWVRAAVAAHPGTPMSVQAELTSDPDPEVRQVARSGGG